MSSPLHDSLGQRDTAATFQNHGIPFFRTLLTAAFAALLGILHHEALAEWYARISGEERYSHSPLVLLVSLYLLWRARACVGARKGGAWAALAVAAVAAVGLIVGELSALWTVVQYSLTLMLLAIAWSLTGREFRKIAFPFLLLFTVVPLPYMIDVIISGKMQLLSSSLGVKILRLLDVSVFLEGNIVDLGSYKLQVVEACAGLNYMFPLITLGVIAAYFYQASWLARAVLVLSTVPITILMNSARVALVGLLVNAKGPGAAEGVMHYFEGWVVFLLCMAVLALEVILFERLTGRRRPLSECLQLPALRGPSSDADQRKGHWIVRRSPFLACVVVAAAVSFTTSVLGKREERVMPRRDFFTFPTSINGWQAQFQKFENNEKAVLGLDDYLLADFRKGELNAHLYVGYVASQRKGFVPHSPKACIPGGGWEIVEARTHVLNAGTPVKVTRLLIGRHEEQQVVYYWFRQRGRDLPEEYSMKFFLLYDSIEKNRTDGSIVRIVVPVQKGRTKPDEVAEELLREIYPKLPAYVPD
jgi:exosortase D (VPLPA-CTERM-specific)